MYNICTSCDKNYIEEDETICTECHVFDLETVEHFDRYWSMVGVEDVDLEDVDIHIKE